MSTPRKVTTSFNGVTTLLNNEGVAKCVCGVTFVTSVNTRTCVACGSNRLHNVTTKYLNKEIV